MAPAASSDYDSPPPSDYDAGKTLGKGSFDGDYYDDEADIVYPALLDQEANHSHQWIVPQYVISRGTGKRLEGRGVRFDINEDGKMESIDMVESPGKSLTDKLLRALG